MNLSIWRYSHLTLAVSSFLFLALAAITGIILSFEPALEKINRPTTPSLSQVTLAESIPVWKKQYPSISQVEVDDFHSLVAKSSDFPKDIQEGYIHPQTGEFLGATKQKGAFFEWVNALHRSLFLHELGRFFVGLTAFLLFLITISGILLLIQRQQGIRNFFKGIPKDSFAQYYHVVLSRWSLLPILLIALTGAYLSLVRFEVFPAAKVNLEVDFDKIKDTPQKKLEDFPIFKNTSLSEVKSIEFPFSEDPEDYFTIKLKDREIAVNQITGEILAEQAYPFTQIMSTLSLDLHTGRASIILAIILAIASGNILFFIYTGFAITFKRLSGKSKNQFTAEESRFVILVGSENGSTWDFANGFYQQLIKLGEKTYISTLNEYQSYPSAEHLVVFTSTYGAGDAPNSASKFQELLSTNISQPSSIQISVVGFGSRAYPDFCQFAYEVHHSLGSKSWAKPLLDIHTVNDKSEEDYALWAEAWSAKTGISISSKAPLKQPNNFRNLEVVSNTSNQHDDTFLIKFKTKRWTKVKSGDLLAIYPANDHRERLYSIGVVDKSDIQLSVRLHENGLGSGFLHRLKAGDTFKAKIVQNSHFHFPKNSPEVIMICNGTGIGPFLGMLSQNNKQVPCHLYAGFRDKSSLGLYQSQLDEYSQQKKLNTLAIALSRETEKLYVGDLIKKDAHQIATILKNGGVIMICGSLAMQKDVMVVLEQICEKELSQSLSHYQAHEQILSDCY